MIDRLNAALEGRYHIERELGQGGMATVYLADDLKHDRKVALKVLRADLSQMLGKERFLSEIRTTANLQHPNILPLFDSGAVDELLFYVMPWVDGESLRDRLDREGQLSVDQAVRIASEVAEALDHAHRQGVVHRDVKPANVLLRDGRPLVADFGIALAVGTAAGNRITETGLSLGTPYYMSPEQAMGDQPVTGASDQYALACLVYEMLTGEPPHTGGTAQAVLARILTGAVAPVSAQRPAVPANVDGAVLKALERIPGDRFSTTAEFRAALNDPAFRYGEVATPSTKSGTSPLVVVAIAVIALLAGWTLRGGGGNAEGEGWDRAQRPTQLTFSGQATLPAISPDGAWIAWVEQEPCRLSQVEACESVLRVRNRFGGRPVTLAENLFAVGEVRWARDGVTVAFSGVFGDDPPRRGIFAVSRLGGAIRTLADLAPFDFGANEGEIVAVLGGNDEAPRLARISVADGAVRGEIPLPVARIDIDRIRVSPDGERIFAFGDQWAMLFDRDGAPLDSLVIAARRMAAWGPDGDEVFLFRTGTVRDDDLVRIPVAGDAFGEVTVVRGGIPTNYRGHMDVALETGDVVWAEGTDNRVLHAIDLGGAPLVAERFASGTTWYGSPELADAATVYYLRGDAAGDNLYRFDLATRVETALTEDSLPGNSTIRISPRGERLLFGQASRGTSRIGMLEIESGRIRRFEGSLSSVHVLDDGRLVDRVTDGDEEWTFGIWPADTPSLDGVPPDAIEVRLPDGRRVGLGSFDVSPDGDEVAYVGRPEVEPDGAVLDPDRRLLMRTSLVTGESVVDAEYDASALSALLNSGVIWTSRGIFLRLLIRGDDGPSLWRWNPIARAFERDVDLPVPCPPGSISIDRSHRTAVCASEDVRIDIRLLPGPGR